MSLIFHSTVIYENNQSSQTHTHTHKDKQNWKDLIALKQQIEKWAQLIFKYDGMTYLLRSLMRQ